MNRTSFSLFLSVAMLVITFVSPTKALAETTCMTEDLLMVYEPVTPPKTKKTTKKVASKQVHNDSISRHETAQHRENERHATAVPKV
jgi:hypothetical protein